MLKADKFTLGKKLSMELLMSSVIGKIEANDNLI